MTDAYKKTEADIAYERYNKMGSVTSDEDIPVVEFQQPTQATAARLDGVGDEEIDSVLVNDDHLSSDIGLNNLNALDRDEVLESDAIEFAMAAGLTGNAIDYAKEDLEGIGEEEDLPLEDVPDADEIESDTPVDPASPPQVIVHGTDLINGSKGE